MMYSINCVLCRIGYKVVGQKSKAWAQGCRVAGSVSGDGDRRSTFRRAKGSGLFPQRELLAHAARTGERPLATQGKRRSHSKQHEGDRSKSDEQVPGLRDT